MQTVKTDTVVLGGGPAGYVAAIRLGQLGVDTVLIEKDTLGGVCLNRGCIPSKALISSASKYLAVKNGLSFGIQGGEHLTMNMEILQQHKNTVVKKLTQGVASLLKQNKIRVISGNGVFKSHKSIVINGDETEVVFSKAMICTGSEPVRISGITVDGVKIIESDHALDLDYIPESMTVLGGGVIGVELGEFYASIGTRVTIVEAMDQILPGMDKTAIKMLTRHLKKMGIAVMTDTRLKSAVIEGDEVTQIVTKGETETTLKSEVLLVTVGRKPSLKGCNLASIGIDENAPFIEVNEKCETGIDGIYAAGDVTGGILLAHKASHQALVAAENIAGNVSTFNPDAVPAICYSMPEFATCGLTPETAMEAGYDVDTGKFPFAANGRALATGETEGFVQVVSDKKTGVILGAQILHAEAGELLTEFTLAVEKKMKFFEIGHVIHPHPTLSEALMEASLDCNNSALHIPPSRSR
ncbi:MAG: dihydrolipoyl dehydrogenase [Deltaproteobacteria bacterium]|nr:dihydrolipoyl dehydrogenase [Deltaproteobacteria bacterium]